jgi:hypothetical protein
MMYTIRIKSEAALTVFRHACLFWLGLAWHKLRLLLKTMSTPSTGRTCKVVIRPNDAARTRGSWVALNLGEVMLFDASGEQLAPASLTASLSSVCCNGDYPASNCANGGHAHAAPCQVLVVAAGAWVGPQLGGQNAKCSANTALHSKSSAACDNHCAPQVTSGTFAT